MPVLPSANHILAPAYLGARDATRENTIPIGAMVGGLAGGAALAILGTVALVLWARAMRKGKEKHKREAVRSTLNMATCSNSIGGLGRATQNKE
jgi:hypothetical protein